MTKITYIPGEIANAAIDEQGNRKPVTRTQHIFDDSKGKSQAEVNADIDDTLALHQSEINALDSQNYVTVDSFNALPATGSADTVYRVSNWDGTQQDPSVYSEYAWNGSQYVHLSTKTQIGEVFDISAYHATGGTLATYADLTAALDSNNGGGVPQSLRKGGMSVKFVHTYDNKYMQYRLMKNQWSTTVSDWQGVDKYPIPNSENLVKSGGVFNHGNALDVSELCATENPHTLRKFADLISALVQIPSWLQNGGMSVKYISSVDNKYRYWFCKNEEFTIDTNKWYGETSVRLSVKLPEWEADKSYIVGNEVTNNGLYYRCTTAHTSVEPFATSQGWAVIDDFVAAGEMQHIVIGGAVNPIGQICLKLYGILGNLDDWSNVPVGSIVYQKDRHQLRLIGSSRNSTVPFSDGAVYTLDNRFYIWDGANLVPETVVVQKINLPEWVAGKAYVIGNQVTNSGKYYRCTTNHNSTSPFDTGQGWSIINDFTLGGEMQTVKIGKDNYPIDQCCLELYAILSSFDDWSNVPDGGIVYNESTHLLRKKIDSSYKTVPFYKGAIYTLDGHFYIWNGSTLIKADNDIYKKVGTLNTELNEIKSDALNVVSLQSGSVSTSGEIENSARVRTSYLKSPFQIEITNDYSFTAAYFYYLDKNGEFLYRGNQALSGQKVVMYQDVFYYRLIIKKNDNTDITSFSGIISSYSNSKTQNEGGLYIYPFACVANKPVMIYKDAVFSGLNPLCNYEVRAVQGTSTLFNYSEKCLRFLAQTQGIYSPTIEVVNQENEVISKQLQIRVIDMPNSKLSNSLGIDVFFMGDSIIGNNRNLIGQEFRRMLATNDAGGTQLDGSILLEAMGLCVDKINLVGEMDGDTNVKFQYNMYLSDIFTGKRDIEYGAEEAQHNGYWQNHNPYYNLHSSQPDEVGADGFNKRVDFGWYFQNACGTGKIPSLIYISIGANDYGSRNSWQQSIIPSLTAKVISLCKKIKSDCDNVVGGESGIKIKLFNHQTYPQISAATNNIPIERARHMQCNFYDSVYKAITNTENGVSSYVSFVDCASKFDWVNGYNKQNVATNRRCTSTDDVYISETVHMNAVGAYNYADCLIDDFIADSSFD